MHKITGTFLHKYLFVSPRKSVNRLSPLTKGNLSSRWRQFAASQELGLYKDQELARMPRTPVLFLAGVTVYDKWLVIIMNR